LITSETNSKTANSYVSVDYADNYFSTRGVSSWEDFTDDEKEVFLIKATDFIDNSFEWHGTKATEEQELNFPRLNLFDNNGFEITGIPVNLKKAVCVACLYASKGKELFTVDEVNGAVTSEQVGSIHITYDVSKKKEGATIYTEINSLLKGLYHDKTKKSIYGMKVGRVL